MKEGFLQEMADKFRDQIKSNQIKYGFNMGWQTAT